MTREELSQCIDSCGDNVYGFCLHLTGNRADADDLYQDTFLTALEKVNKICAKDNPGSYLMGIALRLWKNNEHKEARRKRIAGTESLEDRQDRGENPEKAVNTKDYKTPEDMAVERELNYRLNEFVDELDSAYRIPISLYYAGGKSVKEIASIMKLPLGTVKRRLYRARKILRKKMEDAGYDR